MTDFLIKTSTIVMHFNTVCKIKITKQALFLLVMLLDAGNRIQAALNMLKYA